MNCVRKCIDIKGMLRIKLGFGDMQILGVILTKVVSGGWCP